MTKEVSREILYGHTTVATNNSFSDFQVIAPNLLHLAREYHSDRPIELPIVYGSGWCVVFTRDDLAIPIEVNRGGQWIALNTMNISVIPPYSFVHWRVPAGRFTYEMYYCMNPYPEHFPSEAVAFQGILGTLFSETWISDNLELRPFLRRIETSIQKSQTSKIVEQLLIERGFEETSLESLFRTKNLNPSSASRSFKKDFGIAPMQYRALLRTMRAQELLLLSGKPIAESAFDVGYKDLGQFYRHFKRHTGSTPKSFVIHS